MVESFEGDRVKSRTWFFFPTFGPKYIKHILSYRLEMSADYCKLIFIEISIA